MKILITGGLGHIGSYLLENIDKIKFIKKNSILMIICDKYYDINDYLETFDEYKKYLKKS